MKINNIKITKSKTSSLFSYMFTFKLDDTNIGQFDDPYDAEFVA